MRMSRVERRVWALELEEAGGEGRGVVDVLLCEG